MANVVVLGAGLGGTLMAYELLPELGPGDTLTVIGQGPSYHFVPSNPWVAVGWRERDDVEINLVRRDGPQTHPLSRTGRQARASGGKSHRAQ